VVGGTPPTAKLVTDEPCKVLVVLGDLDKLPMQEALAAPRAGSGLCAGHVGGVDVLASGTTMLEVLALARFAAPTDGDLIDGGCIVLAGDEPNAILEAYLAGVVPVELESA
jgi:hypothetical protein